jgi:hypothetical protein
MAQAVIPFAKHRNAKITWTGKGNPAKFHIKVNGPWYFGNWTVVSKSPSTGADVLLSSMEEYLEDNDLDHIFSLRTANARFNEGVGFANEEGVLDFDVMIDANPDYQITGYSTRPSSEARPGAFILKYEKAPEATAYLDDWDEWDDWDPDDDLYSDTYGAQYGSLLGAAAAWGAKKAVGKGVTKYMDAYQTASDPDASPKEKRKAKKFLERIHRRIPASTLSPEAQAANRWLDLFRRESGYPTQEAVEELIED